MKNEWTLKVEIHPGHAEVNIMFGETIDGFAWLSPADAVAMGKAIADRTVFELDPLIYAKTEENGDLTVLVGASSVKLTRAEAIELSAKLLTMDGSSQSKTVAGDVETKIFRGIE